MAVPRTRAELLDAIETTSARLIDDLRRVPPERARETTLPGHRAGTTMSPADLVAYLVGWNRLVISWHDDRARGFEPDLPASGFSWADLGPLAQRFYADAAHLTWPQLLEQFASAQRDIVRLVEGMTDDELYGAAWYRQHTAGRMIQLNTSSPCANARRRLRAWLRSSVEV